MTEPQRQDASDKALRTWAANNDRTEKIAAFMADPEAPPAVVSEHTDRKSAYTVRARLARRYPDLVFKVTSEPNDSRGFIQVSRPEVNA